ncbi:excisionase family protein [Escherichia coli]|uniref:excisionase family protein n=1 Tax=Escherichia coli TaxID=562 RepID=UPI000C1BA153|nr:excisionase family protein [Escherichia coli]
MPFYFRKECPLNSGYLRVTLELLMAVTGLRKGTILRARDSAWMNGREYKQIAPDGTPKKNSECLYHLPTINTWIKNQPLPSQDV